ncbi:MAG TPA: hypothetical protein VGN61_03025 [Verrucomicrobiae bacterium]|jgi:hypothetical protein
MKNILCLVAAASLFIFIGGQSVKAAPSEPISPNPETRNNCYSLLHQLLDEQKDVSMLRFIKREHTDVKDLIKKIAKTSKIESKLLEKFAKKDPPLILDDIGLPPGEVATRAAIASTKKKAPLGQKGDEFELSLLLTQTEALNYAWHLAQVAGENDTQPDRAHALAGISEEMKNLYHEVFLMLLSKINPPLVHVTDNNK